VNKKLFERIKLHSLTPISSKPLVNEGFIPAQHNPEEGRQNMRVQTEPVGNVTALYRFGSEGQLQGAAEPEEHCNAEQIHSTLKAFLALHNQES
jgi:hypothetical protein